MKILIIVGLACVVGVVLIGAVTTAITRAKVNHARADLTRRLGPRNIVLLDEVASFYGLASRGRGQARGNGCLVLTTDEVVFEQWMPTRLLRFPRLSITDVSTVRSFKGKTRGKRLLRLTWSTPDGADEQAAWQLQDLDAWLAALRP